MDKYKVADALRRIGSVIRTFRADQIFLGTSGGKDSVVIQHLTQRLLPHVIMVHNVKPMLGSTGDPIAALTEMHPETLEFLYSEICVNNEVLFMHSSNMYSWISYNNMKCQIDGARIEEATRPGKSADIIRSGKNVSRSEMHEFEPDGIFGLSICYPILDWTNIDVFDYLYDNNLKCSEEYLKNGEYNEWKEIRNLRTTS